MSAAAVQHHATWLQTQQRPTVSITTPSCCAQATLHHNSHKHTTQHLQCLVQQLPSPVDSLLQWRRTGWHQHREQQQQQQQHWHSCQVRHTDPARLLVLVVAFVMQLQVLVLPVGAAVLLESSIQSEGNVPSELSAAGEKQGPRLSSLMQGTNRKQIEGCTRRCVPTCIRGGEGAPGLGPISMRREIVVFKDGFRSRQYCLSECAQTCKLISDNEQQQQQKQP